MCHTGTMTSPIFVEPGEDTPSEIADVEPITKADAEEDFYAPTEEAPFGYTTDRATGERRPKLRPGRPKKSDSPADEAPSLDELKSRPIKRGEDVAPTPSKKRGERKKFMAVDVDALPPFRAGPIAKGMNSLYRRAGKLVRLWDPEVGTAIVSCTFKEDEDDVTVGDAWENLAKSNPRIRAFLMRLLETSAWGGLVMAHLPIFMAIVMKDGIRDRLPLAKLTDAFLTDDNPYTGESGESSISAMLGGLNPEDAAQMMQVAQGMMAGMGANLGRSMNATRVAEEEEA